MVNTPSTTCTENGAKTFDKTGSKVLDLFSRGGSYRSRSETDARNLFIEAFDEDPLLALKTLFHIRDVRGGKGERNFARIALKWLATEHPDLFIKNIPNIVEFGRFDDLFCVF